MALYSVLLIFGGCAAKVRSDITTFHELSPEQVQNHTVVVLPADEAKRESLEFRSQKAHVESGLRELGMKVISVEEAQRAGADYVAFFGYASGAGRERLYSYSVPIYGQTGVSSAQSYGTVNILGPTATYSGTTTYTPQYGITGYRNHIGSNTVYDRTALLNIWTLQTGSDPRKVYESTISSSGSSQQIVDVLDEMVAALFNDFWTQGNRNETVTVQQ
jgi:hypothetical protein